MAGALLGLGVGVQITRSVLDAWQELSSGRGYHHMKVGNVSSDDVVLYKEQARVGFKLMQTVRREFSYRCKSGEEITGFAALDGWDDDTGGNASIQDGGVGRSYVTVKVESAFGRGFDFTFIVYGKKR